MTKNNKEAIVAKIKFGILRFMVVPKGKSLVKSVKIECKIWLFGAGYLEMEYKIPFSVKFR